MISSDFGGGIGIRSYCPVAFLKKTVRVVAALFCGLLVTAQIVRADSVPGWLRSAASTPAPTYDKSVGYVVLLEDQETRVNKTGQAESHYRYVVRLLTAEGRSAARHDLHYDRETTISKIRAWHIRTDGGVIRLKDADIKEESLPDDLYSDGRTKVIRFPDAGQGSVVAFEWVQKQRPFINQDYHFFQNQSPVILSRYQLRLPAEWDVESFVFNHPPISPTVVGAIRSWEVRDLPPIKEEPLMPEITSTSPYLAVSYFPSHGKVARRSFASWSDVSHWQQNLDEHQVEPTPEVRERARALTAMATTDIDKVRAIGRWVQKEIRYVSIQLGSIGGYRPHPAGVVLRKGYGDCKDKACLMQAMLQSVGIKSFMVLVYTGDAMRVRPEFPSPLQFNHAIVAIAGTDSPGADTSDAGHLLFFDPTDSVTPVGDLPYYLQGSYGLVVMGDAGKLSRLPLLSESANTTRRELSADVQTGGIANLSIREALTGQSATAGLRLASAGQVEAAREVQAWVSKRFPGAQVGNLQVNDRSTPDDKVEIDYLVTAPEYANRTGSLFVIKPLSFWPKTFPSFPNSTREQPIIFDMKSVHEETVRIKVPDGLSVDELPSGIELGSPFGRFQASFDLVGHEIAIHRSVTIFDRFVPASGYAELKHFFDAIDSASETSIVLVAK